MTWRKKEAGGSPARARHCKCRVFLGRMRRASDNVTDDIGKAKEYADAQSQETLSPRASGSNADLAKHFMRRSGFLTKIYFERNTL